MSAEVQLPAGPVRLAGLLTPPDGGGLVVFVHGSGSGRLSPRNQLVATALNRAGLGTLLFDLLTPAEERDRANVFDIALLAGRLAQVTAWVRGEPAGAGRPVGYFGASTGAAAALWAAAEPGADIAAVVSRGGRPDLAADRLSQVRAPTLLVRRLAAENRLAVVPGASHLFAEPGTLESVADLAADWFSGHLGSPEPGPR